MPSISTNLRIVLWIVAAIFGGLSAVIGNVLAINVVYFFTRRGRRPTQRPIHVWTIFILGLVLSIGLGALAAFAPDLPDETENIPIHTTLQAQATQTAHFVQEVQKTHAAQDALATQQVRQTQQAQATQYTQGTQQAQQILEEKLIVVIAAFEGPEDVYGLRNEIIENLSTEFSGNDAVEILIKDDVITPGQGSEYAWSFGKQHQADIVIWGWYRSTENPNITIHVENLSADDFSMVDESSSYQPAVNISDLESFEIQKQLGTETTNLISFLMGYVLYRSNDYEVALQHFEPILNSGFNVLVVNQKYLSYYAGNCNLYLGRYEKSIQYFDQAIQRDLNFSWPYNFRGAAYSKLGMFELALQDFNKAIQIDPSYARAYNNRGGVYIEMAQYQKAIEDFETALEIAPNFTWPYMNLGTAYDDLNIYDKAMLNYDEAIRLNPKIPAGYYGRGVVYRHQEQYEAAVKEFTWAIQLNPQYIEAYGGRGASYRDLGQYERAIKDFSEAIKLDPKDMRLYSDRGITYYYLEQFESAINDFNASIELDPEYAGAYNNRALAYRALGKSAEAEADFKKYKELTGKKP